ncbi:MAG: hypothetical protein AAF600_17630 [Bacteroidota bacterium]
MLRPQSGIWVQAIENGTYFSFDPAPNNYSELFEYVETGSLLKGPYPEKWERAVKCASSLSFTSNIKKGSEA